MRATTMRSVVVIAVLFAAGCTVSLNDIPVGAQFACTQDSECPNGQHCANGLCGAGAIQDGATCSANGDCISGACVEGICCHTLCVAQDATTCGQTGHCIKTGANAGQCEVYPQGTACAGATCLNGQYLGPQTCDGTGAACPAPASQACPGGVVCQDAQTCLGQCTVGTTTGCPAGTFCRDDGSGPHCAANSQLNGEACASSDDCKDSHYCDHGICCGGGTCCATGHPETCPQGRDECTAATCTGTRTSYTCDSNQCTQHTSTVPAICDGQVANDCVHFKDAVCGTNPTCMTTCNPSGSPDDSLCDPDSYCGYDGSSYVCIPKSADGGACSSNDQCVSNYCDTANHLCCGTAGAHCCNPTSDLATQCGALVYASVTCDTPSQCYGTQGAPTCINHVCGIDPDPATRVENDSACDVSKDSADYIPCPGGFAIRCSGSMSQAYLRETACPTTCGANTNTHICYDNQPANECPPALKCHQAGALQPPCSGSYCGP